MSTIKSAIILKNKYIYLIRHGETDFNRKGVVQGSGVDSDLNQWGIAQANAFFNTYEHVPFDKIYTSALRRTVQTVQSFIDLGIPYEQLPGLNEISWGLREGKIPNSMDDDYYRGLISAWRDGQTHVPSEGGESPQEVRERQLMALTHILAQKNEKTILIAMHGRAMRILLTTIFNKPLHCMDEYEHSNVCLYRLHYSYETTEFTLEQANDTTHLLSLEIPQMH